LFKRFSITAWEVAALTDVRGNALPGGHNLPEELPEQTLSAILEFVPYEPLLEPNTR
jgi:hypothetical protein